MACGGKFREDEITKSLSKSLRQENSRSVCMFRQCAEFLLGAHRGLSQFGGANRLGAGLLVMPTHGRTGLDRLAFGSVAESVLRRAPCAVFALKSYGRIPLSDDVGVDLPVAQVPLDIEQELGDALANHDV